MWTPPARLGCTLLLLLGAVWVPSSASGQPLRVTARLSADSVKIGERFTLSLAAEHPAGTTVRFPAPDAGPEVFGGLEVIGRRSVGRRPAGGGLVTDTVAYEVAAFALDSARVPPIPVRAVVGGDTTIATTAPRAIPMISVVQPDAAGLRVGDPLAPFPEPWWPWLVLGAVGAALAGSLAYWWRRRTAPKEEGGPERPPSPTASTPYETATARLRQLRSYDLAAPDEVEAFYVELADALRAYLAEAWGVAAPERTTRDVVTALRERADVPAAAVERVQSVLARADRVKFAGVRPGPAAGEEALQDARDALDALEAAAAPEVPPIDAVAGADPEAARP